MLFSIVCVDKPNSVQLRMDTRPEHVEHLKAHADRLLLAGPNLAEDGTTSIGSILIFQAETAAEAKAFADADETVVTCALPGKKAHDEAGEPAEPAVIGRTAEEGEAQAE